MKSSVNRVAYCIFSDDIRQEIGNKTSLIGIYANDIVLSGELPLTVPRLCMSLTVRTAKDCPMENLSVRATFAGENLVQFEIPKDELVEGQKLALESSDDEGWWLTVNMALIASPLNISSEGIVEVVAIADGDELLAGRLRVQVRPPEAAKLPS